MNIRQNLLTALAMGSLFMYSCSDTETKEPDPCVEGTPCFCESNPEHESCEEKCEVEEPMVAFIEVENQGLIPLEEGQGIGEFVGRIRVGGENAEFMVYDTEAMDNASWGGEKGGAATGAEGDLFIATEDCGGNDNLIVTNADGKDMANVTVDLVKNTYTLEFDDANVCSDHDMTRYTMIENGEAWDSDDAKEHPMLFAIGAVNGDDSGQQWWGSTPIPLFRSEDNPNVYEANVYNQKVDGEYHNNIRFTLVWNKAGQWGDSMVDEDTKKGIAKQWGIAPGVTDMPAQGTAWLKAFEIDLTSGSKIENPVDCGDWDGTDDTKLSSFSMNGLNNGPIQGVKIKFNLVTNGFEMTDLTHGED